VYPQGCDVANHLSLFLCVADYDKLLPGWSHFAQVGTCNAVASLRCHAMPFCCCRCFPCPVLALGSCICAAKCPKLNSTSHIQAFAAL
jgi:hypothetical protein